MPETDKMKIRWTWEEWQAGRAGLKAVTDKITPDSIRRKESSSDKRLKAAFGGKRGPDFIAPSQPSQ